MHSVHRRESILLDFLNDFFFFFFLGGGGGRSGGVIRENLVQCVHSNIEVVPAAHIKFFLKLKLSFTLILLDVLIAMQFNFLF